MATIAITGGTGLIGMQLSKILAKKGHTVYHLSRKANPSARFPAYRWDPAAGEIDTTPLEAADHIVLLAGAGIVDKSWTKARKQLLIDSRVQGNTLVGKKILELGLRPKSVVAASAIGFYGDRGHKLLEATSPAGNGFLSECTQAWENSLVAFDGVATRLVTLRIGIVFSMKGGALEKLVLPFKFGAGNYFGKGDQYYSWIHIDDMCRIFEYAIRNENMAGIYNGVGPNPATTKEIAYAIKQAMKSRALVLPVPEFALKLAMGARAEVVLNSTKVSADKLTEAGFEFRYPDLLPALEHLIKEAV